MTNRVYLIFEIKNIANLDKKSLLSSNGGIDYSKIDFEPLMQNYFFIRLFNVYEELFHLGEYTNYISGQSDASVIDKEDVLEVSIYQNYNSLSNVSDVLTALENLASVFYTLESAINPNLEKNQTKMLSIESGSPILISLKINKEILQTFRNLVNEIYMIITSSDYRKIKEDVEIQKMIKESNLDPEEKLRLKQKVDKTILVLIENVVIPADKALSPEIAKLTQKDQKLLTTKEDE